MTAGRSWKHGVSDARTRARTIFTFNRTNAVGSVGQATISRNFQTPIPHLQQE